MNRNVDKPQVVVVGSVNLDVVMRTSRFPAVGETVTGATVLDALGGKGANQAVAAARHGARVAMVACVGEDAAGDTAGAALQAEGIDTTACRATDQLPTGRASIVVDPAGRNSIVVADGANAGLTPEDVDRAAELIDGAGVVVCQLEIRLETVDAVLTRARSAQVVSILNTAPALAIDRLTTPPDILVSNRIEAEQLSELPGGPLEALASALQGRYGCRTVVITDGEHGAVALDEDAFLRASALVVDARDTTGAGDAFVGTLAARLAAAAPLEDALVGACAAGSLATQKEGAMPSLPTRAEVEAAMTREG